MQSILDKLRVITLSNLHSLLDGVKALNSIGEYEQYLRDLSTARNMLDDQAASHRSDVDTLPQEIDTLETRHAQVESDFEILVAGSDSSNDLSIKKLGAELENLERQIGQRKAKLEPAKAELAKYEDAVGKLDLTIIEAQGKLETLRDLAADAKANKQSARLMASVSIGEAPDTDEVENRLRREAAVAGNQLDRSLAGVTAAAGGGTMDASVAARIARTKAKLAGAGAPTEDEPAA
jgi:chromosome segregation ATPase